MTEPEYDPATVLVVNVSEPQRRYVVDRAPAPMFPVPDSDRDTDTVLPPELSELGSELDEREHCAFVHALLVEKVTLPPCALDREIVSAPSSSLFDPKLSDEAEPAEIVQPALTVNEMLTVAEAVFCAVAWTGIIKHKLSSAQNAKSVLVRLFMGFE